MNNDKMKYTTMMVLSWIAVLYFAEGLPFGVFMDLLPVWLRNQQVSLQDISALSLLGLLWTLKFLWAPAIDHFRHHRRWIFGANALMALCLAILAFNSTVSPLSWLVIFIFIFCSATNDSSIDGYTILLSSSDQFGRANGVRNAAYRVGLIFAGILLIASGYLSWTAAFLIGALIFLINGCLALAAPDIHYPPRESTTAAKEIQSILRNPLFLMAFIIFILGLLWPVCTHISTTLTTLSKEYSLLKLVPIPLTILGILMAMLASKKHPDTQALTQGPILGSFISILSRPGILGVIAFTLLYKVGEAALGFMVKPFWVDAGFSNQEIGLISVNIGSILTILGGIFGGWFLDKNGIIKSLVVLGIINAVCGLFYAIAAHLAMPAAATLAGEPIHALTRTAVYCASMMESFSGGMSSAGFLAFLIAITDRERATAQYAVFSSIFAFSRSISGWLSGYAVHWMGYPSYFLLTVFLCFPAFLFLPSAKNMLMRYFPERA